MAYNQILSDFIFTPVNTLPKELMEPRLSSEVMEDIYKDSETLNAFRRLSPKEQEALIEFCMGNRGLKVSYDPFFQKLFNVDTHPERLSRLISAILKQPVKIKRILPREGTRFSNNSSLMIMDVLVELSDGSLINVEIQKHGYYFPVQRSFCYGSDLLVRQYLQLRDSLGEKFTYNKMRPVFVIVLMDNSPKEFAQYPNTFLHRSHFSFDSELEMENLLNFIFVPLDIFRKMSHNEIGELEAWLYFLGSDNPFHIEQVIRKFPFFKELYQEIIDFRYHPKELIGMFSKALEIMDRNTVDLMIDDMKKELDEINKQLREKNLQISEKDKELTEKDKELTEKDKELTEKAKELSQKDELIAAQAAENARLKALLEQASNR